jgi:plastocyanin
MSRRLIAAATAAVAAIGAAAATPALGGSTPSRNVEVGDNFFAPTRLTVDRGTRVAFRWSSDNENRHDVAQTSGPRGTRAFKSPQRTTDYTYRRTFRTAGTYRIICTLHPTQMRLTLRVRSGG